MIKTDYIVISGQGRSGTKWIAKLFDLSPKTHIRNQPNEISNTPLDSLPYREIDPGNDIEELDTKWDDAIEHSSNHIGWREIPIVVKKDHMHQWCWKLGFYRMMRGPKYRKILGLLMPELRNEEWRYPWWLGNKDKFSQSIAVMKIVQPPGWTAFVLRHRKNIFVSHIIRHPGGFINSWLNRYVSETDINSVHKANISRLKQVASSSSHWHELLGDIDSMDTYEAELWYWRYSNETIITAGKENQDNFQVVVFEDLAADPLPIAKDFYDKAGLEFTDEIQSLILSENKNSGSIAGMWKNKLNDKQIELVESFLEKSFLGEYWDY